MNGASSDHNNQRSRCTRRQDLRRKKCCGTAGRIVAAILIFYKNLTACWQPPTPFPLGCIHAGTGSAVCGFFVRCRTLQKCNETIQRRSRLDDCKTMSAATLKIQCSAVEQALPISHGGKNSFLSIGVGPPERHCPSCDSIVYSRRHRLCGVCGQMLPEDCLFTATEAENVEMLLRIERQRHRAWLKKTAAI